MFTEITFNALTVLRAMLCGYAVEIEGEKYAYDVETRKIGVLNKEGDDTFIVYCDINLNRFLSMCEQVAPEKILEILAVLQHSPQEALSASGVEGGLFH